MLDRKNKISKKYFISLLHAHLIQFFFQKIITACNAVSRVSVCFVVLF